MRYERRLEYPKDPETLLREIYPDLYKELSLLTHGSKEYHLEGAIINHLRLAYENAKTEKGRLLAFLHDIGKPYALREERERITFPEHATISANLSREILYALGYGFKEFVSLWKVIAYHHPNTLPKRKVSMTFDEYNLWEELIEADTKGNISKEPWEEAFERRKLTLMERIEGFYAESPYRFGEEEALRHLSEIEEGVILLAGPPASGKDTFASKLKGFHHFGFDDERCKRFVGKPYGECNMEEYQRAFERAKEEGLTVQKMLSDFSKRLKASKQKRWILNSVGLTRKMRRMLLSAIPKGLKVYAVQLFSPTLEELLMRNRNRAVSVPEEVVEAMYRNQHLVEKAEGFVEVFVI
jgi:predicted kinase